MTLMKMLDYPFEYKYYDGYNKIVDLMLNNYHNTEIIILKTTTQS